MMEIGLLPYNHDKLQKDACYRLLAGSPSKRASNAALISTIVGCRSVATHRFTQSGQLQTEEIKQTLNSLTIEMIKEIYFLVFSKQRFQPNETAFQARASLKFC